MSWWDYGYQISAMADRTVNKNYSKNVLDNIVLIFRLVKIISFKI